MQVALPLFLFALPAVFLFGFLARRYFHWPRPLKPHHIAESGTLANLPSYKKIARRHKLISYVEKGLVILILANLTILAARPLAYVQKVNEEETRDIVLCLDGSGSMRENIGPSLEVMKEIVNANPTDRYAIVIFQTTSYPALPLTRDVVAINDTIDEMLVAFEEERFSLSFAGYEPNAQGGTDIAAGMLGCMRRFSDLETPRSRHVIMISDLEHNGELNPRDTATLYAKYGIELEAIVPANAFTFTPIDTTWLNLANGNLTELDDGEDFKAVLSRIYASILNTDETVELVAADNPMPYYVIISLAALALGGLRFVQERRKS